MAEENGQNDHGIKSFSVGLGDGSAPKKPMAPPPAYRILIAGDFGTLKKDVHEVSGMDISEILLLLAPKIEVIAENTLGSFPTRLAETFALERPRDLRPRTLFEKMAFVSDAREAFSAAQIEGNSRFDRLRTIAEAADNQHHKRSSTDRDPRQAGVSPASDKTDDGLDGLFSMVDTGRSAPSADQSQDLAKQAVGAFVSESLGKGAKQRSDKETGRPQTTDLEDALTLQASVFLKDDRFGQVFENWLALRLLLANLPRDSEVRLFLCQVSRTASADELKAALVEAERGLSSSAFDVILAANRQSIVAPDVANLKTIASLAQEHASCVLATLLPSFAGVSETELARMDAPHQILDGDAFAAFKSLRSSAASASVALFWNDGCVVPGEDGMPAFFAPAAWLALIAILRAEAEDQWPRLPTGVRYDFDRLELCEHVQGATEVASVCRTVPSPDASDGLSRVGITCVEGQANRISVFFRGAPILKEVAADAAEGRGSLDRALALARLNTLLQIGFRTAAPRSDDPDGSARDLGSYFAGVSDGLGGRVQFEVSSATDEDGDAVLDIDATVRSSHGTPYAVGFRIQI
ncbi:hypothetical protein JM93_04327 [Roseibium hamelinense]|uniref:TssC1 N-terminal domain-containing protein n=1 Tax=Roseibium hamelinense TaxID=150831 RepID=A0A562SG43_9HYPH|nr:hypothetical protein [Roseibium hamelinense]MTI42565.1 hypothetical protein [Roseibium hamelinense]TWI79556.1 hypothetical protein JM93_04327 [Roseibium hamelinense]